MPSLEVQRILIQLIALAITLASSTVDRLTVMRQYENCNVHNRPLDATGLPQFEVEQIKLVATDSASQARVIGGIWVNQRLQLRRAFLKLQLDLLPLPNAGLLDVWSVGEVKRRIDQSWSKTFNAEQEFLDRISKETNTNKEGRDNRTGAYFVNSTLRLNYPERFSPPVKEGLLHKDVLFYNVSVVWNYAKQN
ncbi:hypothetical protein EV702DRAFT_1049615 [Suillus placidus]|uniref:Uncharacterized protein n=1 Tax=Suillus placidus TaxID=48579 RepID=A0A9P6ZK56_9AGAM|nr:hypothetical protein EV702DRAFT_1049615 [Suillus placidus]